MFPQLRRIALVLAGLVMLTGCSQQAEDARPLVPTVPHIVDPAPARTGPSQPVAAKTEDVDVPATALASLAGSTPVAGADYVEIVGGQPYEPADGKIEVVEVFGYVCPACALFQPLASAWEKKLPEDVKFSYIPAPFGADWNPYAEGFYVAKSMGLVAKTHEALIDAIHIKNSMPGEGDKPSEEAIANFYARYGANAQEFLSQMRSFTTDTKVSRGKQFMIRSGVESTPTIVVAGKYRVRGKSFEDVLRITEYLIAQERAKGVARR